MPFAQERVSYSDTRKRTSDKYVKFNPNYKTTLRILNPESRMVWKHWIAEANNGRGMGAVCPNVTAKTNICPIDKELVGLSKEEAGSRSARPKFIVNVLDRTAYTTCPNCNTYTPGKNCQSCDTLLKGAKFEPLNKVKILEQGPKLFNQGLNGVEKMQADDFDGAAITDYDINFMTQGTGRDRVINPAPLAPSELPEDSFIDRETGEIQQLWDLDLLAEPTSVEEIEAMMRGATVDELNAIRGIE